MALNFPSSPTIGLIHVDSTSGFLYEWDGVVWKSYQPNSVGNIKILDDISGSFNGIADSFPLTSIGTTIIPANAQQLRIVLGGVIQEPGVDYTISGSNLIFTTPPAGALSFSGVSLGSAVPINTVLDGTVTPSKLSAGGPSWNTDGSVSVVNITGIAATFNDLTVNGTQTIINTTSLEISDKTVGIGSTSTPSDSLIDGAGIIFYGTENKTLTYNNTKKGFEFNIPLSTNETRLITGAEKVTRINGNTVNLVYNSASGSNVGYATNPSGNITVNVTDIPTSSDFDDHSISFAIIVNSIGTARTCTAINLNGVSKTIHWSGGSLSNAIAGVTTTNGHTIFSFTGINTVGSASTTANYQVFGIASGGFW